VEFNEHIYCTKWGLVVQYLCKVITEITLSGLRTEKYSVTKIEEHLEIKYLIIVPLFQSLLKICHVII
jgi:hypothetical protein